MTKKKIDEELGSNVDDPDLKPTQAPGLNPVEDDQAKAAAAAEAAEKKRTPPKPKTPATPKRVKIILEENDDIPPTGLYVGLNGRGYLIVPGEEVDVPAGVVDILDHAITSMPQMDSRTRQIVGYRDRMRYPYRRV